ncbi:MAG: hypothetical protein PHH61_00045 [Candidatus Nanoarchaeia archaeon]|nr:hypothetical protein [Candidatus Nanoarchaeia archaeon]
MESTEKSKPTTRICYPNYKYESAFCAKCQAANDCKFESVFVPNCYGKEYDEDNLKCRVCNYASGYSKYRQNPNCNEASQTLKNI